VNQFGRAYNPLPNSSGSLLNIYGIGNKICIYAYFFWMVPNKSTEGVMVWEVTVVFTSVIIPPSL